MVARPVAEATLAGVETPRPPEISCLYGIDEHAGDGLGKEITNCLVVFGPSFRDGSNFYSASNRDEQYPAY